MVVVVVVLAEVVEIFSRLEETIQTIRVVAAKHLPMVMMVAVASLREVEIIS